MGCEFQSTRPRGARRYVPAKTIPPRPTRARGLKLAPHEFVRMRLKKKISHKYSLGTGTINVCLIDAEIENKIYATRMNDIDADTDFVRNVCKAISLEVAEVFNSSQLPILLTTMDIRPKLKKMLELCHPEIVVLSYQELSPDTGVNALARVSI